MFGIEKVTDRLLFLDSSFIIMEKGGVNHLIIRKESKGKPSNLLGGYALALEGLKIDSDWEEGLFGENIWSRTLKR